MELIAKQFCYACWERELGSPRTYFLTMCRSRCVWRMLSAERIVYFYASSDWVCYLGRSMFKTAQWVVMVALSLHATRLPIDGHLKAGFWAGKHAFRSVQWFCFALYALSNSVYGDKKWIKEQKLHERNRKYKLTVIVGWPLWRIAIRYSLDRNYWILVGPPLFGFCYHLSVPLSLFTALL